MARFRSPIRANTRAWNRIAPGEPELPALFDPGQQVVRYQKPLWQRFILLAMGCFLLDLLMRRVRLFDRTFQRRPRRESRGA